MQLRHSRRDARQVSAHGEEQGVGCGGRIAKRGLQVSANRKEDGKYASRFPSY